MRDRVLQNNNYGKQALDLTIESLGTARFERELSKQRSLQLLVES
jgi:hypothetical protein